MERTREIDALPSKTVGRRRERVASPADIEALLRTAWALRGAAGLAPRGVFRFTTFEEAEEWLKKETSRRFARRRSTTSAGSAGPSPQPKPATS